MNVLLVPVNTELKHSVWRGQSTDCVELNIGRIYAQESGLGALDDPNVVCLGTITDVDFGVLLY
jgi:hypothetical protein